MDAARAYAVASQWGSFVRSGDPGACFYGFHMGDGRPVSEEHRIRCLDDLGEDLIPMVKALRTAQNDQARKEGWSDTRISEVRETIDDLRALSDLHEFIAKTELRPVDVRKAPPADPQRFR